MPISMPQAAPRHQFWIDRGGTFTDCIHRDRETGALRVTKVLSSDQAPLEGIRALLGLGPDDPIPPSEVRMGTTLATNALLERGGCRCVLVADEGLGDLIRSWRPDAPRAVRARYRQTRAAPRGGRSRWAPGWRPTVRSFAPLTRTRSATRSEMAPKPRRRIGRHCTDPRLPRRHARASSRARSAEEVGFTHVSVSSEISNELGLLGRTDTTVANAYLTPLLTRLPDGARTRARRGTSANDAKQRRAGRRTRFIGRNAVLSGPAAGVVATGAVARGARSLGSDRLRHGWNLDRRLALRRRGDPRVRDARWQAFAMRAPMIELHTVAAGGGSICTLEGKRMTVGPQSAGAEPGPLCYGNPEAAELALTDVSLLLGRIADDRFPFRLDAERPCSPSSTTIQRTSEAIGRRTRKRTKSRHGFLRVAVENMAAAIQKVSVGRGHDVRTHSLVVFGGAGGQYACLIADRLGIQELVFHPYAGALSAFGMGVANFEWHGERDAGRVRLDEPFPNDLAQRICGTRACGARDTRTRCQPGVDLAHSPERCPSIPRDGDRPRRRVRGCRHDARGVRAPSSPRVRVRARQPPGRSRHAPRLRRTTRCQACASVGPARKRSSRTLDEALVGRRVDGRAGLSSGERSHRHPHRRPGANLGCNWHRGRRPRLSRGAQLERLSPRSDFRRTGIAERRHGRGRRPGASRGLPQPVQVDRGANGRRPPAHGDEHQHSRPLGLLLRRVRLTRAIWSPTLRTFRSTSAR